METEASQESNKSKHENLWKTINRFDFYINSTNTKAAFIIAFNTFMIGLTAINCESWINSLEGHDWAKGISVFAIFLVIGSALYSIRSTFAVINPLTTSNKKTGEYHSSIFFGDVSEFETASDFEKKISSETLEDNFQDLARQTHALAVVANSKFKELKKAIWAVSHLQTPALMVLLALRFIVFFLKIVSR